ncbi:hypothetical protein F5887DRAFT_1080909 [Amanita rubescens]|nr:hypothetical protein F5887DRAFT_1080909 [Amanita rubescens]
MDIEQDTTGPVPRFVTDDFSCRVLLDMIRKENVPFSTGLLYGVQCTKPVEVPIPQLMNSEGWDFSVWISFDSNTRISAKAFRDSNDIIAAPVIIILYVEQTDVPEWYENGLLSNLSTRWKGNVLLLNEDGKWPATSTIATDELLTTLLSETLDEGEVHEIDWIHGYRH